MTRPTDTATISATREEIEALSRIVDSHPPTLSEWEALDRDDAKAMLRRFAEALPKDEPVIVARSRTRVLQRGAK